MSGLAGKTALVTGSSSGIGAAIAVRLVAEGVSGLMLAGRDDARLEGTARRCQRVGAHVVSRAGDLATSEGVASLVEAARSAFDGLDILVHSAGVFSAGAVAVTGPQEFERQWRVNTWAPYALTHALLAGLKSRRGQVVFINSGAGANALPNCSAYCASKFALRALADSLRQELAPEGVRVLSAMLGKIATPLQERLQMQRAGAYHPEQYPSAQDVAELVIAALALPPNAELVEFSLRPQHEGPR
jgi:NAD(P)-dependent dehydrogenase (short-subunit alcohol dehydrogenase family)